MVLTINNKDRCSPCFSPYGCVTHSGIIYNKGGVSVYHLDGYKFAY